MIKQTLSFISENRRIKTALLKKVGGEFFIEDLRSFDAPEELIPLVKQLYMHTPLFSKKDFLLSTALPAEDVLLRNLTLPIPKRKKALAALPFQLENAIPFPLSDAIVAASLFPQEKKGFSICAFTAEKKRFHFPDGLDPEYTTATPQGLYRLAKWLFPNKEKISLLYIGSSKTCCVIGNTEHVLATHCLQWGHMDFFQELSTQFPLYSPLEIHEWLLHKEAQPGQFLCPVTRQKAEKELDRLFQYLKHKGLHDEDTAWMLLGDLYPALDYPSLFTCKGICLLPLDSLPISQEALHEYALPIGISLETLAEDHRSIRFALPQEERPASYPVQKRKKRLLLYLASCCIATITFMIWGQCLIYKIHQSLTQQLAQYLPSSLDPEQAASVADLQTLLYQWESSIKAHPTPFPFQPTVPSVSDVLAWLSTHPVLTSPEGNKKKEIDIKNIHYQLYKYPKLGESGGTYAAKVNLEFIAETPRIAREFHDALLKGDLIVDPKKEIRWRSQQDTYWTSFELRLKPIGGA